MSSIPTSTPPPYPLDQTNTHAQKPPSPSSSTTSIANTSPLSGMHTLSEYEIEVALILLSLKREIVFTTRLKTKLDSLLPIQQMVL